MARIKAKNLGLNIPTFGEGTRSLRAAIASSVGLGAGITENGVSVFENVNFQINDGDRVALTGPNGSGKTTLLRLLAGIYWPTSGSLQVSGSVQTIISLGSGLDPNLTGRENIKRLCLLTLKQTSDLDEKCRWVEDFSELGPYLDMPIRTYSTGMHLRLISGTIFVSQAQIIIIDEFFGTGDKDFTHKVRRKMEEHVHCSNILVLATHDTELIKEHCNRTFSVSDGKVEEI